MGTFMIRNTETGIKFDLLGEDEQFLAGSQVYKTIKTCRNGIESVKVCAPAAMVEDQTEVGFAVQKSPKFEVYKDASGELRYRLRSRNGQIIASGNAFGTKEECLEVIEAIRAAAPEAPVVREDGRRRGRVSNAVREADAAATAVIPGAVETDGIVPEETEEVIGLVPEATDAAEAVRSIPEAAEEAEKQAEEAVEAVVEGAEEKVEEAAAEVEAAAEEAVETAAEAVESAEAEAPETPAEEAEETEAAAETENVDEAEAVEEAADADAEEEAEDEEDEEEEGPAKETNYRFLTILFGAVAALACILAICFGIKSSSLQKNVDLLTAEKEQMEVILAEKNAQAENALVERSILIDEKDELAVQNEELNKSVEELTQATTILQEENDELKGQIHNTIEGIEGILTELKATAGIEDAAPLEEDAQEAAVEAIELVEEPAAEAAVEEAAAEEAVTEEAVTEEAQPQDEAAVTEGEEEETFTNVSENLKDQLKQEMMAVMDSEEAQP